MTSESTALRKIAVNTLGEARTRKLATLRSFAFAAGRNQLTSTGRANVDRIRTFKGRHAGQTCVIMGNGPSLNRTDVSLLKDVPTFGLNRIYLMRDKLPFTPTYHVVVNRHVVAQCAEELSQVESPLFTTTANAAHLPPAPGVLNLNSLTGPRFSRDVSFGIWQGATVTYVAMQIAYYMGFSKVVLVGVDHNFSTKGPAHKLVESSGDDVNHFAPNYFGAGFKWQLPDLETSEIAYRYAREVFEQEDRSVVDATVDGKLQVFPKQDLREALSGG